MSLRPANDPEIIRDTAVAYYRYSSDKQDETSIEYQRRAVNAIAQRLGVTLTKEYKDEEVSGKYEYTEKREQYLELKNDILNNSPRPQYLLLYKLDRIGRSQKEVTNCIYDFRDKGVKVITSEMDFSSEAAGAFIGLFTNNAENESNKISARTADAAYEKALKGCFLGSIVPLGYKSVEFKEGNITSYRLEIDDNTAPIAIELFTRYAQTNCTLADLCNYLNGKGIKTGRGNKWNKSSMSILLHKPVYKGVQVYHSQRKDYSNYTYTDRSIEIPDILPRLVSNEIWDLVQKKLEGNSRAPKNVKKADTPEEERFILTNYLYCGHCGSTMSGSSSTKTLADGSKRKYTYYECVNKHAYKACNKCSVDKEYIENYVVSACLDLINDNNINDTAQQILKVYNKRYSSVDTRLQKENKKLQKQLDTLIDALADPDIRAVKSIKDKYLSDIKRLENEIECNNQKLKNAEQTTAFVPSVDTIKNWLTNIKKSAVSLNGKQQLIRAFIKSVWLCDDYIIIYYNIGNDPDPIDYNIFKKTLIDNDIAKPDPTAPKQRKSNNKSSVSRSDRGAKADTYKLF